MQAEVRSLQGGDAPAGVITGSFRLAAAVAPPPPPRGSKGASWSVVGTNQGVVRNWAGPSTPPPPMPPAMRKMMQKQMRQQFDRMYEDVGTELGLSEEQTGKLLDALAASNDFEPFDGMQDPEAMRKKMEERRRKYQENLQALLGPEKVAEAGGVSEDPGFTPGDRPVPGAARGRGPPHAAGPAQAACWPRSWRTTSGIRSRTSNRASRRKT